MSSENLILRKLQNKPYRDAFVASHISNTVALQIRLLRARFGWDQSTLGEKAGGMKQTAISRLENPDYGNLSVNTLKRLASALDVALIVRFASFSEVVNWEQTLSQEALTPPAYSHDLALHAQTIFIKPTTLVNSLSTPARDEPVTGYNFSSECNILTGASEGLSTLYDFDAVKMSNMPPIVGGLQYSVVFTNPVKVSESQYWNLQPIGNVPFVTKHPDDSSLVHQ